MASPNSKPPRFNRRCQNRVGQQFGRLQVVSYAGRNARGYLLWKCVCKCGTIKILSTGNLTTGTKSCGCLHLETAQTFRITHGRTNTAEYRTWSHMIDRCDNPKCKNYKDYGGRGIKICKRWRESFACFLEDMGEKPSANHSIERIDNNAGYSPDNCKWATASEQAFNKRCNRRLLHDGQNLTVGQWSAQLGIKLATIKWRLRKGLPIPLVLFQGTLYHLPTRSSAV